MKIDINRIPLEGVTQEEEVSASTLDLETEIVKFHGPLTIETKVTKITNALTVDVGVQASLEMYCSRCLEEFESKYLKKLQLHYPAEQSEPIIDLGPDIREEIILDYPLKPLCKPDCKGLCLKCGKNLNEGMCSC